MKRASPGHPGATPQPLRPEISIDRHSVSPDGADQYQGGYFYAGQLWIGWQSKGWIMTAGTRWQSG